jgi:hypothetical protein
MLERAAQGSEERIVATGTTFVVSCRVTSSY